MAKHKPKNRQPGRKRAAPVTLPQGDVGPETIAQMRNARVIPHYGRGGDWRFKRREPMHEILARAHGKNRTSVITPRQRNAADDLLDAWEDLDARGSTAWCKPYVDGTGDGSDAMVHVLDKQAHYNLLVAHIPEDCRYPIHVIVCLQYRLDEYASDSEARDTARDLVRRGLDSLADFLGY